MKQLPSRTNKEVRERSVEEKPRVEVPKAITQNADIKSIVTSTQFEKSAKQNEHTPKRPEKVVHKQASVVVPKLPVDKIIKDRSVTPKKKTPVKE